MADTKVSNKVKGEKQFSSLIYLFNGISTPNGLLLYSSSYYFRYRGSIKDTMFLKHGEAEREAKRQLWKDIGQ